MAFGYVNCFVTVTIVKKKKKMSNYTLDAF